MASQSAHVIRFGGTPLAELIQREEDYLIDRVLAGLVSDITTYHDLPAEALDNDIADAVRRGIRLFLDTLATGTLPDREALADVSESAARRAEEEIPLAAVLAAYHTGGRLVLTELSRHVGPEDGQQVVTAAVLTMDFLATVCDAVSARYLEERQAITDVDADRSAGLLRRLLDGTVAPGEDASAYVVVQLRVGTHPDESAPGIGSAVAGHRKLRRLRAQITLEGEDVLSSITEDSGLLVVAGDENGVATVWERLPAIIGRLARAAGAPLHAAGVTAATPTRVPGAADTARELLDLVVRLGRDPGVHRLEDVAVEYQLTRPGAARGLLAASVAPLSDRPDLLLTLRAYLRTGHDRRRTAEELHIHPNTVDYRLQRVRALIGTDPVDRRHTVALSAALLALESGDGE